MQSIRTQNLAGRVKSALGGIPYEGYTEFL